jgi:hypothetical protein
MPGAADLLVTWETGIAASGTHRALLLHALMRPADDAGKLLATPIGERDADLLALRRALFGERANVRLACGECAEDLEFAFEVSTALAQAAEDGPGEPRPPVGEPRPPVEVSAGPWKVRLRLPTPGDLLAVAEFPARQARTALFARCVLEARRGAEQVSADDIPPVVQERAAEAVAAADPRADIVFNVPCPACGHGTRAFLDVAAFVWAELDAWAQRTLLEVHLLAASYGWSEPEVLALSPLRRRRYLELCGHA